MMLETIESAATIAPEDWERVAGTANPEDSRGVHLALEACGIPGMRFFFLVCKDRRGALRGILPVYFFHHLPLDIAIDDPGVKKAVKILRKLMPSFMLVDLLAAGNPINESNRFLIDPALPPSETSAVAARLAAGLDDLAHKLGVGILAFKDFNHPHDAGKDAPRTCGYHPCVSLPNNILDVAWPTFEGYLLSLKSSHRRVMRHNLRIAAASGLVVHITTADTADIPVVYRLYRNTLARAPVRFETLTADYFALTLRHCPQTAGMLEAKLGGRTVACLSYLTARDVLLVKRVGLDYERSTDTLAYFKLFYEAIDIGIRSRVKRIWLGQQSYHSKMRWGARLLPGTIWFKSRNPLLDRILRVLLPWSFASFADHEALVREHQAHHG